MHFDLQLGPFSRNDVCIALVFLRELLTQSKPGEVRMRNVLGRIVASHLVVGAPISRTQVEAFVLCDVLGGVKIDAEGHTDESRRRHPALRCQSRAALFAPCTLPIPFSHCGPAVRSVYPAGRSWP